MASDVETPKTDSAPPDQPAAPEPKKPKLPSTADRLAALERAAGIRYDADEDAA